MDSPEEAPLKEIQITTKKSLREKFKHIKDNITVEPVLATYVIPGVLLRLATQNLNLDKACRVNIGYGDAVCDSLIAKDDDKHMKEELAIQALVASIEVWINIMQNAIPSFLILFLGAWSDRTRKRKMCIILPLIGDILMCLTSLLSVYFFYEIPVQLTMYLEAFFPAITGGWIAVYLGAFSYISDVSSAESRTFRIGVANLCITASGPIASALSGVLLHKIGYYGVFIVGGLLYTFSICYALYYIQDVEGSGPEKATDGPKNESAGVWNFLKSFFNVRHVKETLVVAFKTGPNRRRTKSLLLLTCIALLQGMRYGEGTILYMFTRYRFNWDALKYSFYNTFYIVVHAVVTFVVVIFEFDRDDYGHWPMSFIISRSTIICCLISISLFSRYLKWHDSVLGIISNCSKLIGTIAVARARTSTHMYMAGLTEAFNATSFIAMRSIQSKLVPSDELGKMTSFFNLIEILASMVCGPLYSWLYRETLQIEASTVFYVSTVLTIWPILSFIWFYYQHKKDIQKEMKEKSIEIPI